MADNLFAMKNYILPLLFALSLTTQAKSFRKLSTFEAIEIVEVIDTEGYKNIHLLAINKEKDFKNIPLKIDYIINQDTITDFQILEESIRGNVKSLFLLENDTLKVRISIQNNEKIELKIKGNITIKEPMVLATSGTPISKTFIGNYWDVTQPCIFRIQKNDTVKENIIFNFEFTENYIYDRFFYQVNIIKPDSTFFSKEGEIVVHPNQNISFQEVIKETSNDFSINIPGKYIVEVVPIMNRRRINGIKSTGYKTLKN